MKKHYVMIAIIAYFISGPALAKQCAIVQVCTPQYCPYMNTNDNEAKQQAYTAGCQRQGSENGLLFVHYVSGPAPQCKFLLKVDDTTDCNDLN